MAAIDQRPIPRTKLSDEVAHRIREAILTGQLKSGMRVVQEDWAQRLGVSRMPVRDAVSRLEAEGLVTVSATNVVTVAAVSESDVEDTYQLTASLAGLAARRAATHLTADELGELRRVHEELTAAVRREDAQTAQARNFEFHRLINRGSASPRLISLLRLVSAGVPQFSIRELSELGKATVREHAEILHALEQRDGERACRAIEDHLLDVRHQVVGTLRDQGFFI